MFPGAILPIIAAQTARRRLMEEEALSEEFCSSSGPNLTDIHDTELFYMGVLDSSGREVQRDGRKLATFIWDTSGGWKSTTEITFEISMGVTITGLAFYRCLTDSDPVAVHRITPESYTNVGWYTVKGLYAPVKGLF